MNSHYSPIDIEKVIEITDNDIGLFESLIEVFLQVKSEYISNIRKAISIQDAKELRMNAHQAKSGLGSIGATTASQLALKLERMGKNSDFTNIHEIVKVFEEELALIEDYARNKKWMDKGY